MANDSTTVFMIDFHISLTPPTGTQHGMGSLWPSAMRLPSVGVRKPVLKFSTEKSAPLPGSASPGHPGRHLRPRVESELVANMLDVALGRALGQVEPCRNRP